MSPSSPEEQGAREGKASSSSDDPTSPGTSLSVSVSHGIATACCVAAGVRQRGSTLKAQRVRR